MRKQGVRGGAPPGAATPGSAGTAPEPAAVPVAPVTAAVPAATVAAELKKLRAFTRARNVLAETLRKHRKVTDLEPLSQSVADVTQLEHLRVSGTAPHNSTLALACVQKAVYTPAAVKMRLLNAVTHSRTHLLVLVEGDGIADDVVSHVYATDERVTRVEVWRVSELQFDVLGHDLQPESVRVLLPQEAKRIEAQLAIPLNLFPGMMADDPIAKRLLWPHQRELVAHSTTDDADAPGAEGKTAGPRDEPAAVLSVTMLNPLSGVETMFRRVVPRVMDAPSAHAMEAGTELLTAMSDIAAKLTASGPTLAGATSDSAVHADHASVAHSRDKFSAEPTVRTRGVGRHNLDD